MGRVEAAQGTLAAAQKRLAEAEAALAAAVAAALGAADAADRSLVSASASTRARLAESMAALAPAVAAPWSDGRWSSWAADRPGLPRWIRVGGLVVDEAEVTPLLVPFVGGRRPIVIRSRGSEGAEAARRLVQSLTVRIALSLQHGARFYLLDPIREGRSFPMQGSLPAVAPASGDVRSDLDILFRECSRITQTYPETSFDELPEEIRTSERFNVVLATDFPRGYSSLAVEAVHRVARLAPAGAILVIHQDIDADRPGEADDLVLDDAVVIDLEAGRRTGSWHGLAGELRFDGPPEATMSSQLLGTVAAAEPAEAIVAWDAVTNPDSDSWWQGDSRDRLEAVVGRSGIAKPLSMVFGIDTDGRPHSHAAQAGMPGSGKSSLFHALVTSLATTYDPDELVLYLIDGKDGTEFQNYTDLPHAAVVSLRTPPELARSVLVELVEEMGRRNALFERSGDKEKVRELRTYRDRVGDLPRILLIVDEYQNLFDGDRSDEASRAIKALAEKGRNTGIHLLITSQSFLVPGLLHRSNVFGSIHTRIAFQMDQSDIDGLTEFKAEGRSLIRGHCTHVGRAVINGRGGADGDNVAGKVAYLDDADLAEVLARVRTKADAEGFADRHPVVFHGEQQPAVEGNAALSVLAAAGPAGPLALQDAARRPTSDGGLGLPEWQAAEQPLPLLLGREVSVRGNVVAVLERRPDEHLLFVGANAEVAAATAAIAAWSAALSRSAGGLELSVLSDLPSGGSWDGLVDQVLIDAVGRLGQVARHHAGASALAELERLHGEVRRRQQLGDDERRAAPVVLVVGLDLDRIGALGQLRSEYGPEPSPAGQLLVDLVDEGSAVGVHLLTAWRSAASLRLVLPERSVHRFRHRAVLQVSEDDSYTLLGMAAGSHVQGPEPKPIVALYVDTQRSRQERLLPFSSTVDVDRAGGATTVAEQLAAHRAEAGAGAS